MSTRSEIVLIERTLPSERLDSFLRLKFPGVSRGTFKRLIDAGNIQVNGKTVKATHSPRQGEEIRIEWPDARPPEAQPENIPLKILFEDASLIVLNKPAGLVVHPAAGNESGTLVNALLHHCGEDLSGIGGVARPGIVHRLDKETSGCLVVAKTDETHVALSAQFAGRQVEKVYHAILCGELTKEKGEIKGAIARHVTERKRMAVTETGGRAARTSYRILQRLNCATLVEALLHTGRTHQIRVHFQSIGFPLVGDMTYGHRQNTRLQELTNFAVARQMLHAFRLGFVHPRTGKKVVFEAPEPDDFRDALAALIA
jgi:23S rRNA pseudouridine1911/1915/1917 synthase